MQPEYHVEDVYMHSLHCADEASDAVKLAALFHDIGKPRVRNVQFEPAYLKRLKEKGKPVPQHHFFGHDGESAKMTEIIMKRLKFSNAEIEKTVKLVRWHMFYYQEEWTDAAVRRFIHRVGGEEMVDLLFQLRIADAASNPKSAFTPDEIKKLEERIALVRSCEMVLKITDMAIDGNDLMEIGLKPGPAIGKALNFLLDRVIDDPNLNRRENLFAIIREKYKKEIQN